MFIHANELFRRFQTTTANEGQLRTNMSAFRMHCSFFQDNLFPTPPHLSNYNPLTCKSDGTSSRQPSLTLAPIQNVSWCPFYDPP